MHLVNSLQLRVFSSERFIFEIGAQLEWCGFPLLYIYSIVLLAKLLFIIEANSILFNIYIISESYFCFVLLLILSRHPLQELKNDHLETPMSVTDLLSPMSVDKSASTSNSSADNSFLTIKSERERFYDIVEYQSDILAYLKEAEVIKFEV